MFRLLVGMAFHEGLTKNKLALLKEIHNEISENDENSGIFVPYKQRYHGKIYSFEKREQTDVLVGSSNFSRTGLSDNLECTAIVKDNPTKRKISSYIDYLFSSDTSTAITDAEIIVPGTREYTNRISLETLDDLETYDPSTIDTTSLDHFDFSFTRVGKSEKSGLNIYFGKGRWRRATGKVRPRPWYEVELIALRPTNSSPLYPQGDFVAYTDDGFIIPMKTSGDNYKNIRSGGNLRILGQWIKGKLQKANSLLPLTPVTLDTLDKYGNDAIRFYKIEDGKYRMEF